jgi:membrane fusion protein, multidrug efflux system
VQERRTPSVPEAIVQNDGRSPAIPGRGQNVIEPREPKRTTARPAVPISIGVSVLALLGVGGVMVVRAESKTNQVALGSSAKPVTVARAKGTTFRASRKYVGTLQPWVEAKVGPQFVSAYVDTVLVRPGAEVNKGDVLATLDCRNTSATSQAVAMQARALDEHQRALAHEADRVQGLLEGGYVSPNEAEQKSALSSSEQAQLLATRAKLLGTSLEVSDCVLKAPFTGEVATRTIDPGAFVRPGMSIVSVVDRTTIRVTAEAPEIDFDVVAPGTPVKIHAVASGQDLVATIARRAPSADGLTRTVHFELDVPDPDRTIPVGTTGELRIDVGSPIPATEIPLSAASVRGSKASVFVVEGNVAHARVFPVKGEISGTLFLDPQLPAGALVATEGRALLSDGDPVVATVEPDGAQPSSSSRKAAADGKGAKP